MPSAPPIEIATSLGSVFDGSVSHAFSEFHVCMAQSALARRTEEHEQTSESKRKIGDLGRSTRAVALSAKQA